MGFFQICGGIDEIEILDLLLHRYGNIEYVLGLDIGVGVELILHARDQEKESRIFQQWVAQLPIMAFSDCSVSFADYKARVIGTNIDTRPTWEILEEVAEAESRLGVQNGA